MELNEIHTDHEEATTSLKVVLLVFAVVLVGALSYLVWAQNTAPDTADNTSAPVTKKTETTTTKDETADWKTFTGTYFSFKYPLDWQLVTTGLVDKSLIVRLVSPEAQKKVSAGEKCLEICLQQIDFRFYDKVADETENKENNYGATTLDELVTKSPTFTKIGTVTINDSTGYDGIRQGLSAYYQVYFSQNVHLYEIFFNHRDEKSKVSPTENLIIGSYKIIK